MNWKEFKEFVENNGITDDFEVENINMCYCEDTEDLGISIYTNEFEIF